MLRFYVEFKSYIFYSVSYSNYVHYIRNSFFIVLEKNHSFFKNLSLIVSNFSFKVSLAASKFLLNSVQRP